MTAYRLTPIPNTFGDPRWERSSTTQTIWVDAATPDEAREIAANATGQYAPLLPSPWLSAAMATCVPDVPDFDLPSGMAVGADGRPIFGA
jgi:hypothetical protein